MSPITIKDGLLSADLLQAAIDTIKAKGWLYGWKSNTDLPCGHWHCGFAGEARKNREAVTDELPPAIRAVWDAIQPLALPDNPVLIRGYANAYTFGTEGYPHIDSKETIDRTAVIYLNEEWDRNWGGETAFFQGREIIASVMPKFGRVVTFPSHMYHSARSVTRMCLAARTVLVFKSRPDEHSP